MYVFFNQLQIAKDFYEWALENLLGKNNPENDMQPILRCDCIVGNDLARVLRWGPGYNGQEHPVNLLRDLIEADEIKLDRYVNSEASFTRTHTHARTEVIVSVAIVTTVLFNRRWTVIFHPNDKEIDETRIAIQHQSHAANTNEDPSSIFVMNNYFGIGIDADLCLDFHMAREENPDKFSSR